MRHPVSWSIRFIIAENLKSQCHSSHTIHHPHRYNGSPMRFALLAALLGLAAAFAQTPRPAIIVYEHAPGGATLGISLTTAGKPAFSFFRPTAKANRGSSSPTRSLRHGRLMESASHSYWNSRVDKGRFTSQMPMAPRIAVSPIPAAWVARPLGHRTARRSHSVNRLQPVNNKSSSWMPADRMRANAPQIRIGPASMPVGRPIAITSRSTAAEPRSLVGASLQLEQFCLLVFAA